MALSSQQEKGHNRRETVRGSVPKMQLGFNNAVVSIPNLLPHESIVRVSAIFSVSWDVS